MVSMLRTLTVIFYYAYDWPVIKTVTITPNTHYNLIFGEGLEIKDLLQTLPVPTDLE